ncbi:hypothetical protein ACFLSJ_05000, partial [Verrucomicrobiota bacterium]
VSPFGLCATPLWGGGTDGFNSTKREAAVEKTYKECIRMLNGLEKSLEKHLPDSERRWPLLNSEH